MYICLKNAEENYVAKKDNEGVGILWIYYLYSSCGCYRSFCFFRNLLLLFCSSAAGWGFVSSGSTVFDRGWPGVPLSCTAQVRPVILTKFSTPFCSIFNYSGVHHARGTNHAFFISFEWPWAASRLRLEVVEGCLPTNRWSRAASVGSKVTFLLCSDLQRFWAAL